jgi:hypothetical protein
MSTEQLKGPEVLIASLHNVLGHFSSEEGSPVPTFLGAAWYWPLTSNEDKSREAGKGRDINNQAMQGPRKGQDAVDPVTKATSTL